MLTHNFKSIEHTDPMLLIRGQWVMLDADLAGAYDVSTRSLKAQVHRHRDRFPEDFMFELTAEEKAQVAAICDHLRHLKYSRRPTFAFTLPGRFMLATILGSKSAVEMSLDIIRALVNLHKVEANYAELAARLSEMELKYDQKYQAAFEIIRRLQAYVDNPQKPSGSQWMN